MPDVVKGEFVNIGVVLREAAAPAGGAVRTAVRFTRDWTRVRCLDADADTALLEGLEAEIAERLRLGTSERDPKAVLAVLEDSLSNSLQLTEARATLAEDMAAGMDELLRLYVEPMRVPRGLARSGARAGGRTALAGRMREEFERAGVWPLMRKRVAAAPYTRAGDPLKLDCGHRVEHGPAEELGTVRLFQAVSLAGDVETAKGLAFSAPQLREGVRRIEGAALELTAVVEPLASIGDPADPDNEAVERYRFGVETMERGLIRVVTLLDLARAAQTARRELGLL